MSSGSTSSTSHDTQAAGTRSETLLFRDRRAPEALRADLERDLMVVLPVLADATGLVFGAAFKLGGAAYQLRVDYLGASADGDHQYQIHIEADWRAFDASYHDYFSKNAASWFGLWTETFDKIDTASPATVGSADETAGARLRDEDQQFAGTDWTKSEITDALKRGMKFMTAHSEGGTHLTWSGGKFIAANYGESTTRREFASDEDFLAYLRNFFATELSRTTPAGQITEPDAWRLIYRRLSR